jgi:OTU domain-containing protein 6
MARLKKPSRQKARLARRVAEREAEAERAADEAANQTDHRKHERKIMDEAFARLGLKEIEIRPDGHCLYSAVAHQLLDAGMPLTAAKNGDSPVSSISSKNDHYREVRATTADFLLANADDFAPFLEEPIDAYARKIKLTTEWGGQLELQAIARAYGIHINVIQGDGRIEKFEPGDTDADVEGKEPRTIWLAYYRHTYGLGEHYNALTK